MELQTDKECARLCWSSVDIKIATNFVMSEKSNFTSLGKTDSVMLAKPLQLSNFSKIFPSGKCWE